MLQAQLFTLYPEVFPGPLNKGMYGKALDKNLWSLNVINIRDAAKDKHKTVDDTPYGGGSGMLLKADILANSIAQEMLKKGFLASTSCYTSLSHSDEILESYLESLDPVFSLISDCENGRDVFSLLEGPVCHNGFKRLN